MFFACRHHHIFIFDIIYFSNNLKKKCVVLTVWYVDISLFKQFNGKLYTVLDNFVTGNWSDVKS